MDESNAIDKLGAGAAQRINSSDETREEWKNELIPFNKMMWFLKGTEYLIKPLICKNAIGTMFGDSGTMKSFIALDLGLCIASGIAFHGYNTHQGGVVYICGENFHGTPKRVKAWCMENEVDCDKEIPFFITKLPVELIEESSILCITDDIRRECPNPSLIIIDTLSANFGAGDESSNSDVGRLLSNITTHFSAQGAGVLFVHHVGHGAKDRERGAYALRANVDFRMQVNRQHESNHITLTSLKVKDGACFDPIAFKARVIPIPDLFDSEGMQETSVVLDLDSYEPPEAAVSKTAGKLQLTTITILKRECEIRQAEIDKRGGNSLAWVPRKVLMSLVNADLDKPVASFSFVRSVESMIKKGIVISSAGDLYRVNS